MSEIIWYKKDSFGIYRNSEEVASACICHAENDVSVFTADFLTFAETRTFVNALTVLVQGGWAELPTSLAGEPREIG